MSVADWIIIVVVVISVIQAASEGFFHQAFGMAGLVLGYLLAAWQYRRVADWFSQFLKAAWFAEIAGFLTIFIAVMVAASLIGRLVRWAVKEVGLSFFDRALGAVLGLARGALFVAVFLMGMTAFAPTSSWLNGSQLAPYFLVAGRAAIWVAPAELRARFYQGLDLLHRGAPPPPPASPAPPARSGK
jgi:membrane protein required for colicin V production